MKRNEKEVSGNEKKGFSEEAGGRRHFVRPTLKTKSIVFTLDASFALLLVLAVVPALLLLVAQPVPTHRFAEYLHALAEDTVDVLALTRVSDVRNEPVVQDLFAQGMLDDSDLNRSLLDVAGLYWSANNSGNWTAAGNLSQQLLSPFLPQPLKWEFQVGGDVLYNSTNRTNSSIWVSSVSRRAASGFSKSAPTTGYVARAFLENVVGTDVSSYFFFGGFVGQGNLTATLYDIPLDANLSKLYLEMKAGTGFNFYVNNVFCQSMSVTPGNFSVDNWTITDSLCLNAVLPGAINNFSLNFSSSNFSDQFVGGGYLKAVYSTQQLVSGGNGLAYYRFPGIQGLVNLYDSFYVPGNITAMSANLTFYTNSNYSTLLWIGNTTVLNHTGTNQTITAFISDADFQANFSANNVTYAMLSNSSIPLRMLTSANISGGLINGTVDIVLITDTSGSMSWRLNQDGVGGNSITNCSDPNLYLSTTSRISLARCLDKDFVNAILGGNASSCSSGQPVEGNRVALVDFGASEKNWTALTDDIGYLTGVIDSYTATGGTCISCGINRAYQIFNSFSNANRSKYIVVMTDGVANYRTTPECYDLNDVGLVFAVGESGAHVQRTPPWFDPSGGGASDAFNRISALNSSVARAGADGGEIYRWNGTAWLLETDTGSSNVYGIDVWNETLGFAVGASAKIWRWNGASWSETNDFGSFNFWSVAVLNSSWAFAVGDAGRIYYWNGAAWNSFTTVGGGSYNLYGVDGLNASQGGPLAYAAGASGKIYVWAGGSWSEATDTGSNTHYDVSALNNSLTFTASSNGRVYQGNASSWSSTVLTPSSSYPLKGVHAVNGTLAYAVGDPRGDVYEWNGATWSRTYSRFYYEGNSTTGLYCSDNDSCSLDITQSYPALNANYSTARVFSAFNNLTVDSVGFGPIATCQLGNDTVTEIARTGNGSSYSSANATELKDIYCQIAQNILTKQTETQQVVPQGSFVNAILDPSSFIRFVYTPDVAPPGYQEITLNAETTTFPLCEGGFFLSPGMTLTDARLTSYSGFYWTKGGYVRNSLTGGTNQSVFNLSVYGPNYSTLGDPYSVYLPVSLLSLNETNYVVDELGLNRSYSSPNCSSSNRVIYTLRLRAYAPLQGVFQQLNGSNVTVYFDRDHDGIADEFVYVSVGAGLPNFNATPILVSDLNPANNALHDALLRLLDQINFVVTAGNSGRSGGQTNPVDVLLSGNVKIETDVLTFIPYVWGPVDMNVVVWA